MRNTVKISRFISFEGTHVAATRANYAEDAGRYIGSVQFNITRAAAAASEGNTHDAGAYAYQAGLYARIAAHCALRSQEL